MKTCVVIPTYNESKAIGEVVRQIRNLGLEVIVIDDGSQDNTSDIAQDYGATVLRNEINEGKGASLIKGSRYALNNDCEALIFMDGDGQHLVSDIPYFMRLAKYSHSGIFIGNRMTKPKTMPQIRFITNKFMSWLISKIAKQRIPDTQCGFRLIKAEVLRNLRLVTCRYETESEILIRASRMGVKIESVPIKTIYSGEKSQINPLVDTLRFIKFMVRVLWITPY